MAEELAYIPDWRSDETLYSWVASFHAIHGNGSARETGTRLYAAEHACRDRDAPRNLQHFVDVTRFKLGDVQSLLLTRTPLGLFIPFLPESRQQVLSAQMGSHAGPGWRQLCGMPASRLRDSSVFYYCEECVAEDLDTWGLPRWRLPHQLAGSWICLEHGLELTTLSVQASEWILPPSSRRAFRPSQPDPVQGESLRRMATLALQLIGASTLDVGAIRQAILVELRDQGVTTWRHPLDKTLLAYWFASSTIASWMRLSTGPWNQLASGAWIHDLLRNRVGDHPLKWMLLWCNLFADQDYTSSHRRFMDPVSSPLWDASGQASIWGTTGPTIPADIQRLITHASTLEDAAQTLGMAANTLRHRLAELGTNAGVFRLDASFDRRKQRAVSAIRNYIAAHPRCSKADIHRSCKAAVSWIRANEPESFAQAVESLDDQHSRQMSLTPEDCRDNEAKRSSH